MYYSDNETSCTSASEDIGSEDTPEEVSEVELDFRSSSTSSSAARSVASSAASSPRRSPRLQKKRSRIVEKEAVSFWPKRRRIVSPSPDLSQSSDPGSGESSVGRSTPSLPSTRSCSPLCRPAEAAPPLCRPAEARQSVGKVQQLAQLSRGVLPPRHHHHHHHHHHYQQGELPDRVDFTHIERLHLLYCLHISPEYKTMNLPSPVFITKYLYTLVDRCYDIRHTKVWHSQRIDMMMGQTMSLSITK
ncbi:hypothetical protein CDAR_56771 [Caerostris darwini]|uniref:Uncharacterized protein n=1 Tax=Caerostris darwini TaxID=1538125 RepID=A0AAV4S344_9ARAC|nr:hypothetical protein CDAR_56771 [Caerostris darwini]